ncbi:MAG: hypothetical protein CSB44_06605 [Gammaproteobacteria bacterium]|nr:MAG: hypothetical protein CSB44_06605 [Gammaproteobacteria bacterium]
MNELLWFLLPVAAAAGWFAGKRNQTRATAAWNYANNIHKDVNLLLSERTLKPDELLDSLAETDGEAADTYIALGNLFRRRGDVDKAILLHESLLNTVKLEPTLRSSAMVALAQDYDSAGLMDRAEALYRKLIASNPAFPDYWISLIHLHEREHDWAAAIESAQAMKAAIPPNNKTIEKADLPRRLAHFHCELALRAAHDGYEEQFGELLEKALSYYPESARAHIMLGQRALRKGRNDDVLEHFRAVEAARPALLPEIIDDWFAALRGASDPQALDDFIEHIRGRRNAYSVIRTTRDVIAEREGEAEGDRFLKEQIVRRPSLKSLRDWVHDQVQVARPEERENVQVVATMLDQVVEEKPLYACRVCGFNGNVLHWQCPGCARWDTVTTIVGIEGE